MVLSQKQKEATLAIRLVRKLNLWGKRLKNVKDITIINVQPVRIHSETPQTSPANYRSDLTSVKTAN